MRQPKPYYRQFDGWWYVQIREGGKRRQVKLAKGQDAEDEAYRRYFALMADRPCGSPVRSAVPTPSVVGLLDQFLDDCQARCAATTYSWYLHFLQGFAKYVGPDILAAELRPFHVTEWLRTRSWSPTTQNGAIRAVRRAFRWLADEGRIAQYPLSGLRAPQKARREVLLTSDDFRRLLDHTDDAFGDLLRFLWYTGARPQEARLVQKRHVDLNLHRIVFPPSESKGKRAPRVIYLNDEAQQLIARLCDQCPTGALFRNAQGKPWTRNSIRLRFKRLRGQAGQFCAYHIRHTFATNALQRLDPITVSVLMGHSDASQLARTYQHLAKRPDVLIDAARRATGEGA